MMRRGLLWLAMVALVAMVVPAQEGSSAVYEAPHYRTAGQSACSCGSGYPCGACACGGSPATKLGRGVTNVLTGWLEIPKHVLTGTFNCNVTPLEGFFVGLSRGTGRALERTGIGIYEAVTFPLPGFDPLLLPEYVSLEPSCTNWRYGEYCAVPFCGWGGPPCPPAACAPCAPCGPPNGPWGAPYGALRQPAPPPQQAPPPAPGPGPGPGGVTYPDDYLK